MKYVYFLLFILIGSALHAQHLPLVSSENQWNTFFSATFSPNTYTRQFTFAVEMTQIENQEYYELLVREKEEGAYTGTGKYYRQYGGQVYEHRQGSEHLLYDFDMEAGDLFSFDYGGHTVTLQCWETSIHQMMDSSVRSRYLLRCIDDPDGSLYGDIIWLEGIGSMTGLGYEEYHCAVDGNTILSCFFSNNNAVFENSTVGDCWRVNSREAQQNLYRIFPNPVQDFLNIEQISSDFRYEIKSMGGKSVQYGRGEQRIDVQQLPEGMYLLEILTENKVGVMKFMKR